jgi:Peptidase family M23
MRHSALLAALLTLLVAAPAHAAWRPPVDGAVARGFDPGRSPYEGGRHRGIDLAAPPGSVVRAPCSGRVLVAGRVGTSGRVVTVLCGRWRVSQLPLATVLVRRGSVAARGAAVGTVARSRAHAGLHLGVRRDGSPFGYVDPLRFLRGERPVAPMPLGGRGPRPRAGRRWSLPRGSNPRPAATPVRAGSSPVRGGDLAPWPAWAGLALVLAGAGVRWRGVRTRRRELPVGLRREVA